MIIITEQGQPKNCTGGPGKMFAIIDSDRKRLELKNMTLLQLYGEDVSLVKRVFLSTDPICRDPFKNLTERKLKKANMKNLIEYESSDPFFFPESRTVYFFCVKPEGTEFNHMVELPAGNDYQILYFFLPILVVVLGMSAMFSGLNLAIMSFSVTDLKLIQESDAEMINRERADDVLRLRKQSNFVLCTIVCGNCFCNTTITVIINYLGILFGFEGFFAVELCATGLLLIFTEILPALVFTKNALKYASKLQYFVIFSMILTFPISYPLSIMLDKVLGKDDDCLQVDVDSEQLEGMRDEGTNENHNFNEMMNVVKKTVDLRQKRAEDVMTPIEKVTMISDRQAVTQQFLEEVSYKGHSSLPVYKHGDKDTVCGVLNIKDLMLLMDDRGLGIDSDLTAGMMLSVLEKRKRQCFVLNTIPVQFMNEVQQGCTMAIVLKCTEDLNLSDDYKYQVIGIITLEDYMEEIVGEIFDEKDKKESVDME